MDKDVLKYCRYYKGNDEGNLSAFAILERNYYSATYKERHEYWEKGEGYKLCIETFPKLAEFIRKHNVTERGFLAFTAIQSYSHNPMGNLDYLLHYGK